MQYVNDAPLGSFCVALIVIMNAVPTCVPFPSATERSDLVYPLAVFMFLTRSMEKERAGEKVR